MHVVHVVVWLIAWLYSVTAYKPLTGSRIRTMVADYPPSRWLQINDKSGYLEPILKVRTPGSEGAEQVRQHFKRFFSSLHSDWQLEFDQFHADTPIKANVNFTNVIATRDPPGSDPNNIERLVLAAHYDSKIEPQGFIGAIDSAVPCALIMHAVKTIDDLLTEKWTSDRKKETRDNLSFKSYNDNKNAKRQQMENHERSGINRQREIGLQVIFFDGEEAFQTWTDTDSIYGARHLASKMLHTPRKLGLSKESQLASIETFVLLDLIGAGKTTISSFFANTHWIFKNLLKIESQLRQMGALKLDYTIFQSQEMFAYGGAMGDDHLPFLYSGVPILHLIPIHFPKIWHTINDNADSLDQATINSWGTIMSIFLAEYMELGSSIDSFKADL